MYFCIVIQLERHIEILLLDNDCVVVPNFGGFVAHHADAWHDDDEDLFLPPRRLLGFNPKLRVNDNLLAQSYIEAYDICYPEALHRIEDEVEELKRIISEKGSYEFNDIGILSITPNGNYDFTPCEAGLLTPSFYGLSGYTIENISKLSQSREAVASRQKAERSEDTVSVRVNVLRNAVAIAAAILAFFLITPPIVNDEAGKNDHFTVDKAAILYRVSPKAEHTTPSELTPANVASLSVNKGKTTSKAGVLHSDEASHQSPSTAKNECWTIVLASGVSKSGAENYVGDLKRRDLPLGRVYEAKGSFRKVIYGSFSSSEEANKVLATMKKNAEFKDAWILKMNN